MTSVGDPVGRSVLSFPLGGMMLESQLADALGLSEGQFLLEVDEPMDVFGSPFRVSDAASSCVCAFVASVAELVAIQRGMPVRASVDGLHAAVSFHSERLLKADRLVSDLWAPLSGNYRTSDGWVRIHANLDRHAAAARRVLALEENEAAADAVAGWQAEALVGALRAAGGVGAVMRTLEEWHRHPHHQHLLGRPVLQRHPVEDAGRPSAAVEGSHLDGVRVLDCTRVIAGPVAGRLLASFGADVVRIDAPLDDSPTLELDTGWGKTRRSIDLRDRQQRALFDELVRGADVLLEGFRPGALAALGYGDAALRSLRPGLIIGHLSAFGPDGPLGGLRGFDSVVQVATGIAHAVGFDPAAGPGALPAQALDHGAGHLLAAGVVRALATRLTAKSTETVEVSLARVGEWLVSLGAGSGEIQVDMSDVSRRYMRTVTDPSYGSIRHVSAVGSIADRAAAWPEKPIAPRGS